MSNFQRSLTVAWFLMLAVFAAWLMFESIIRAVYGAPFRCECGVGRVNCVWTDDFHVKTARHSHRALLVRSRDVDRCHIDTRR